MTRTTGGGKRTNARNVVKERLHAASTPTGGRHRGRKVAAQDAVPVAGKVRLVPGVAPARRRKAAAGS